MKKKTHHRGLFIRVLELRLFVIMVLHAQEVVAHLLYKMGHYFLERRYILSVHVIVDKKGCLSSYVGCTYK